jgi:hypothetical protein
MSKTKQLDMSNSKKSGKLLSNGKDKIKKKKTSIKPCKIVKENKLETKNSKYSFKSSILSSLSQSSIASDSTFITVRKVITLKRLVIQIHQHHKYQFQIRLMCCQAVVQKLFQLLVLARQIHQNQIRPQIIWANLK